VARVGEATGQHLAAERLVRELKQRISVVGERAAQLSIRPRIACLEWFDPIYAAGHWVPEMIELAGGHDVLGQKGKPSEKIQWKQVVELALEVIVLMPCGFDIQRTANEAATLERLDGWHDLPAVKTGKVFAVNGHAFFSRPGPRLVDGLEILASIIHPEIFPMQKSPDAFQRIA
jgi:iron complex transport system substrate-binding protein